MNTAALIAGYLWMSLVLTAVLFVVASLVVVKVREVRHDWRVFSAEYDREATVTELYPRSNVVPLGGRGESA